MATRLALAMLLFSPLSAASATLEIYESSLGPGSFFLLTPPIVQFPIDIDINPESAEGGGVYGISELGIFVTGDLVIDSLVLSCQFPGCITAPESFSSGTQLRLTGGDNANGDFSTTSDVVGISISGSFGYVVVAGGEYLDATGSSQEIGAIQDIDLVILAEVPEPAATPAILAAILLLATLGRSRGRLARKLA